MDKQHIIESPRLIIRFAEQADIAPIMQLEQDPQNRDFVWQGTLQEHSREIAHPDYALMVFEDRASGRMAGYSLSRINRQSFWAELRRIVIIPKGQGLGKESLQALMKYFFEDLELNKVWLDVYPHNTVAIKLYESLGMKLEGILRQNYYSDRLGFLDQMIYSMLRTEYQEMTK